MEIEKKKLLAAIGIILLTGLLGILVYKVYFAPAPEAPTSQENLGDVTPNQLITSETRDRALGDDPSQPNTGFDRPALETASQVTQGSEGQINVAVKTIISNPTSALTSGSSGGMIQFYDRLDGKFYKADEDGNKIPLSNEVFPAVQSVTWAPNKAVVAMTFPDGKKAIYDFAAKKQYSIPGHWSDINFSPDSQQMAGKTDSPDPKLRYLFTSNIDGTNALPIEPLGENGNKVIVSWSPSNQVIAFSRTAQALGGDRQGVLFIGKNGENFRQLTVEGMGFQPTWSPQGDRVLYSAHSGASDLKPTLWIDGGNDETVGAAKNYLGLDTWASKCTFLNNDEVICAVPDPNSLLPGIGFAPQLATNTNDTVYKVNIRSGLQTIVGKPDGNHTLDTLSVSADGSNLFMKESGTGEILKMQLK
jgi:Tol biopolymer transport system component